MANLKIEKDFEGLLGPMAPESFEQLKQNLKDNPTSFPDIYVWGNHKGGNIILDGHHQYKARVALGLPVKPKKINFDTRQEAMAFAVRCQLGRRNLSVNALARLAHQLRINAHVPPQEAAQAVGVSRRTVEQYAKVQRDGIAEVKKAVEEEEVSVADGAAVATKPKAQQRKAIDNKRNGKAPTLIKAAAEPVDPNSLATVQQDLRDLEKQIRACARRAREVLVMKGDDVTRPWCGLYSKLSIIHPLEHVARTIKNNLPVAGSSEKPILFYEQKAEGLATQ